MSSEKQPTAGQSTKSDFWVVVKFDSNAITDADIQHHLDKVNQLARENAQHRGRALHGLYGTLEHIFRGYTGEFAPEVIEQIRGMTGVEKVLKGAPVTKHSSEETWEYDSIDHQSWALSKISYLRRDFNSQLMQ